MIKPVATGALYSDTSSSTTIVLNKPAGTVAGDLMIAFVAVETNNTITMSGWTVKRTVATADPGLSASPGLLVPGMPRIGMNGTTFNDDSLSLFVLVRTFAAGDPTSWTGAIGLPSTCRWARVVSYRGADTAANQFIAESGLVDTSDTPLTRWTPDAVNSSNAAWRIACFVFRDDGASVTGTPSIGRYQPDDGRELCDDFVNSTDPTLTCSIVDSNGTAGSGTGWQQATWAGGSGSGAAQVDAVASWVGYIKAAAEPTPLANSGITYAIYIDWDNDGSVRAGVPTAHEDVTGDVLGLRSPLSWSYGRDTARSMGKIASAKVDFQLDNRTRIYSPDNSGSALFGLLGTGKEMLITTSFNGILLNQMFAYLDDFEIDPWQEDKTVKLTAVDALGRAGNNTSISTMLYKSIQTGDALNLILDAIDWPSDRRDIDHGATTIRFFWLEAAQALDAINDVVSSEGGPSFAYIDPRTGNFVFRDRHHRILRERSVNLQTTLSDKTIEPTFCAPADYNVGFRDLINDVVYNVDEYAPSSGLTQVWSSSDTYSIAAKDTLIISAKANDPCYNIITPVLDVDYTLDSGAVTVRIEPQSAQTINIVIYATSAAHITGMALRAFAVQKDKSYTVEVKNQTSIDKYGVSMNPDGVPPWIDHHDALALAQIIIAQRSERLAVFSITVNGGNDLRKAQLLNRGLSDRVHIVETETGSDHDYFVEQIGHDVGQLGYDHRVTLGCERVRTPLGLPFSFDDSGAGFDDGLFGLAGYDNASNVLILGSNRVGHRLGEGRLAT